MAERKRHGFKRLAAGVCALGMLCGIIGPVHAEGEAWDDILSAEEETWIDILSADFSDGIPETVGRVKNAGSITWDEQAQNVRVELPASGGGPYLEFRAGGVIADRYALEADFYVGDNFGVSSNLVGKGATKGEGFNIESGKVGLPGTSASYPVTGNAWYHIRYIFDISAGTCDLYVNDSTVAENAPIKNAQPEFYTFRIFNWKAGGYYLIDNVKLQYQEKPSNLRAALTAPENGARYEVGDTIALTADAASDIGVTKVDFYKDGQKLGSDESAPYTFSYSAEQAGTAAFYAVAWDSRNGSVQTDAVTVTVRESPRPVVRFLNLQDGGAYAPAELKQVTVSAAAPAGVDRVELYGNGMLWDTAAEEPYRFDLSGAAQGSVTLTARAYSKDGYTSDTELAIEILPRQDRITMIDSDFEGGYPKGLEPYRDRDGKIDLVTVDDAHGQSVRVERSGDTSPYLILKNTLDVTRYVLEADFYMGPNFGLSTNMVGDAKPDGEGFYIEGGNIILYNGDKSQNLAPIQPLTWYHVKYEFDYQTNTYSLWLDGQKLADRFAMRNVISGFNSMRIFNWQKGSYYCVDNLAFYGVVDYPGVARISYNDSLTDTEIPYDAETVNVVLTAGVQEEQVSAETVRLMIDGETVPLRGVTLYGGNVLKIKPKYHLLSDQTYTVWLSGALQNLAGNPIEAPVSAQFVTKSKAFDLSEMAFSEQGGKLAFRATVKNRTGAAQTCYGVVNVWEGERLVFTKVGPVTADIGGETALSVSDVPITAAQHAEAFVITAPDNPAPVSDKVLKYQR